jgi:inosine/xanthosine triphosphatase
MIGVLIHVGSKNISKVGAVENVVRRYEMFEGAEVVGVEVPVEQFGHPKSLEETVAGAVARAKTARSGADFGFGLESGLLAVPQSKTGYMEVAVCAIFDGTEIHLGLSSGSA